MFKNKFVLIGLVVALLLVTAGGTWFFLKGSATDVDTPAAKEVSKVLPKPQIMSLNPSFVVNLLNERGTRFLQVDIEVMSREDGVMSRVDDYQVIIRHELIMMFSSLTKDQINSIEGRKQIQQRVVDTINAVLEKETGKGGVEEVYFTKFVMQ